MAKRGPKEITDQHKAAMEKGRNEGRVVREYLEALRSAKPKRGRKRTPDSIEKRLATIDAEISDASAIDELNLIQERRNLLAELETLGAADDLSSLESGFVKVAKEYSDRKAISYASWREFGVAASVLKQAGISRAG